ncbi:PEP/pyruvate-binding domain-containing protein [Myxococcota bacterium]|nr:PEP/pyruvate-binding domain-containing protein [Myxococcota bacterium]
MISRTVDLGGKARGLDRLRERGFAVPPYVVVPPGGGVAAPGPGPWAVRSSALDEDGAERSHAGQYLTRLGVPEADLAAAVAEVSASGDPPLAAIVQTMVRAELAGVVFTADPRSGDVDVVVVEWVEGLGEDLVSGRASPHRPERTSA